MDSLQLTADQLERYKRNILLPGVGRHGQIILLRKRVLIVGLGGLGSPVALYLAAAGVGRLGLADGDHVDLSNLQRQILYSTHDLDREKARCAAGAIRRLNPDVEVNTHGRIKTREDLDALLPDYDFVVDATDNFAAKLLINDACVAHGTPFSHGGISQIFGQTMTVLPGKSTCCRCLFGEQLQTPTAPVEEGLFGAIAGILGSIQAAETLKFLAGLGELLTNRLLSFDARTMHFRTITIRRQPCAACVAIGRPEQLNSKGPAIP